MSEPKSKMGIYKAMLAVMAKVGAIGKDQRASGAGTFNYRGIDDVYNVLHGVLVECGVFAVPEVLSGEVRDSQTSTGKWTQLGTVRVKYRFYAEDGSFVEATTDGAATDGAGRALAQAQTDAFKQAMFKTFCIPVKGEDDAERNMEQMADPMITAAWNKMVGRFGDSPTRNMYDKLFSNGPYALASLRKVYAALKADTTSPVADDGQAVPKMAQLQCRVGKRALEAEYAKLFGHPLSEATTAPTLDMVTQLEEALPAETGQGT